MNIIERVEPKKYVCRHCWGNINRFEGLWGTFFEGFYKSEHDFSTILDHTSSNKYWYITQPYGAFDETEKLYASFEKIIDYSINRGADCAIIKDGYHYEGTSCFIFYPADIGRFKEVINSELDTHTRYDACIDIGAPHSMRFDKSYARRLIRNYQIPEKSEIIKSALDFLTWEVKK